MGQQTTTYEIFAMQNGQWLLHGRHPSDERQQAIDAAKSLNVQDSISAVRVVRDIYDIDDGSTNEHVVYQSGVKGDLPAAVKDAARGGGGGRKVRAARRKGLGTFTKLIGLAAASFVTAVLITWVVTVAINQLPMVRKLIGHENADTFLLGVFILSALVSFVSSALTFVSKEEFTKIDRKRAKFETSEKKAWKQALKPKSVTAQQKKALAQAAAQRSAEAARAFVEEERKAEEAENEGGTDELQAELEEPDTDEEPEEAAEVAPALSADGEVMKKDLMGFLGEGLEEVAETQPKLDSFNKFGVNLYLAGACERMAQTEGLNDSETASVLADSVEVLGTKRDIAEKFSAAYDSYLLDPKYLGMIEAGREAMEARLGGDPEAAKQLDKALKSWNAPKGEDETSSGTVAVLFTDIVGSMTQAHGDAAAQEVVRTHNRIVRTALTTYQGREVKHTGDGIMASFGNSAHAVEAGMYIQKKVDQSNATNPAVPLGIKVGINAGEPIVEDDDLFGTTVQLSARIVDKATIGQVLVSAVVRSICLGKSIVFVDRGTREMKGFADPIQLFEAVWDENVLHQMTAGADPDATASGNPQSASA